MKLSYRLGTAEFSIALSALYLLLLRNPQNGLRGWERSRRLTDTWVANTPCWASLGELGWEGCADEEIMLSSCGLSPPTPGSPRSSSPAKPPPLPPERPKPLALPPPKKKTHATQKAPTPPKRKSFESGSSSPSEQAHPRGHGKGSKEKQPRQQKRPEEPPSLEGDESPDPLFGEQVYVPHTNGVYPAVVTLVATGHGGRVRVEHPGEKEMFRVERHLLYASHAAAVTHWEQQKAAPAGKKAAKAKKKPNLIPDANPPAEPAPKPAKLEPKPEAKQAPQPKPKTALEAAPMEVDAPADPSAKLAAQPPTQTHDHAVDGGETQATAPLCEDPTGPSPEV